ncbi:MAG: D-alanine--D-alanine ligase [Desulfobulbaceae bacterium]|nr:D-alanine--D-alanine ligase [Desulfobulbaceae bacterium]
MSSKIRVALLAGGRSGEREVSLKGAVEVEKALNPEKYAVRRYDPAIDLGRLVAEAAEIDVAFILLHGPFGEDGTVQGFLDLLSIPYQGSGVLGSALAMNKHLAKIHYQRAGLTVPDWLLVTPADLVDEAALAAKAPLPAVIKPVGQGSSLGMSIATDRSELLNGLKAAFQYGDQVMIEQFIKGREITGGVLGNDQLVALPLVEVIPGDQYAFFNYEAKYQPGASREICPADFDADTTARARDCAIRAHRALQLRGYSRTDMMVAPDGTIYIIETNTIPGMTPTSLLPQAAKVHGLDFGQLLDRLIDLALEKS